MCYLRNLRRLCRKIGRGDGGGRRPRVTGRGAGRAAAAGGRGPLPARRLLQGGAGVDGGQREGAAAAAGWCGRRWRSEGGHGGCCRVVRASMVLRLELRGRAAKSGERRLGRGSGARASPSGPRDSTLVQPHERTVVDGATQSNLRSGSIYL
jgi:hypothetical protein